MATKSRKPTRAEMRVIRRREYFRERLINAGTPRDRVAVAVAYLQAVLAATDQGHADAVATRVAQYVQQVAESTHTEESK